MDRPLRALERDALSNPADAGAWEAWRRARARAGGDRLALLEHLGRRHRLTVRRLGALRRAMDDAPTADGTLPEDREDQPLRRIVAAGARMERIEASLVRRILRASLEPVTPFPPGESGAAHALLLAAAIRRRRRILRPKPVLPVGLPRIPTDDGATLPEDHYHVADRPHRVLALRQHPGHDPQVERRQDVDEVAIGCRTCGTGQAFSEDEPELQTAMRVWWELHCAPRATSVGP